MKTTVLKMLLITSFLVVSCKKEAKTQTTSHHTVEEIADNSKQLNNWFQEQYKIDLANSPMFQTYIGDKS